jgi:hypothetical protein
MLKKGLTIDIPFDCCFLVKQNLSGIKRISPRIPQFRRPSQPQTLTSVHANNYMHVYIHIYTYIYIYIYIYLL